MKRMPRAPSLSALVLAGSILLGPPSFAQVNIGGALSDDTSGPLLAGVVYHASSTLVVPNGKTLTVQPGVVVKLAGGQRFDVLGRLLVQGSAASPVVFTDVRDDSAGGDTNGDGGASSPAPGGWTGMHLFAGALNCDLAWLELRYAGQNFAPALACEPGATAALGHVLLRDAYAAGLDLQGSNTGVTASECTWRDNGGIAVVNACIDALPNFTDNHASGNGGNYVQVANGTVAAAALRIDAPNLLEGALVASNGILVPHGAGLTLGPGVVAKLPTAGWVLVHGALTVQGSEFLPVVLTEMRDDSAGGDTNGDGGASAPARGAWRGLYLYGDASACSLQNLSLRYAGSNFATACSVEAGAGVALAALRIEHAYADGLVLAAHSGAAANLLVWDCGGIGLSLTGGSFALRQVTVYGTATGLLSSGWSGTCSDAISWRNGTNYSGFHAGNLRYCDGEPALAGVNGNLYARPKFVDEPAGDFRLRSNSPCIDAGDPSSPLDPDATRADMGALPFDQCLPTSYCAAKPNSQGCLPGLEFQGHASLTDPAPFLVRAHAVLNQKLGLYLYGTSGDANQPFQGGTLCVQSPLTRMPPIGTGGHPLPEDCSGLATVDFNARIQSGIDPRLVVGARIWIQFWSRDPLDPFGTSLTDALTFRVCP